MNKIIKINERQYQAILESVNKSLLNEDSKDIFRVKVPLDVYGPRELNGRKIYFDTQDEIVLTFQIDITYKSWGIDDILIYNINGPRQIFVKFSAEPEEEYNEEGLLNDDDGYEHSVIIDWNSDIVNKLNPENDSPVQKTIYSVELELDSALFASKIDIQLG